jgi:phenylacetate-coenzyme A ligase PaaK-like adenylate-forming protein
MHELNIKQLESYSKQKIEKLQNIRFRNTVRYFLPDVPFYKQLFKQYGIDPHELKVVEDWTRLPLIKKSTYMKKPKDFIVQPNKERIVRHHFNYLLAENQYRDAMNFVISDKRKCLKRFYEPKMLIFSGGTESGNPTPVAITADQKFGILADVLEVAGELLMKKYFRDERIVGMNLFPYAPHLGWHAVHIALDKFADLNLCTAAGRAMRSEELVALAAQTQPNVICGMCSYLKNRWLPMAIEKKIKLPKKVLFVNGAQKMLDSDRQKIAALARKVGVKECLVLDLYGASELKEALMPECKAGSGFHHIAPLSTIVRTVAVNRVNGELITDWDFTETKGYAASWNIDGAGTLLEGFLLGDHFGKVTYKACPSCHLRCMRIHDVNRIREVEAQLRLTGMVEEKIKGTRVNLVALRDAALKIDVVKEAQVLVKKGKTDKLILNYYSDNPSLARRKLEQVFRRMEIQPKIRAVTKKEFEAEGMKLKQIKIQKA